jgi:hydroxyacylglutathione hydrolase
MLLRYFYDEKLAQASYLVGCVKTGEALIVDPARDVTPYLQVAAQEGLRITHITETHIHADFVSGSRELGSQTDATIYLSDVGDENWKYAYAQEPNVILVRDKDSWMVGNIKIEVLHTPGHTGEHIALMVTDTAGADKPMGVFTGDFLFVGDIGRPDLLEEAAGFIGTKEPGARQQFQSVQRFKQLPDYLQVWPGHGSGSACGKALGAIPSTTLGYEKLFNPAFQFTNEDKFVRWLLSGQPEPPRYFAQMKRVNKIGPALLKELAQPQLLGSTELQATLDRGEMVIDLRPREQYNQANLPGTLNIPANNRLFSTFVGWFVDYNRPMYLIVPTLAALPRLVQDLRAIGIDQITGYFAPEAINGQAATLPLISAQELATRLPKNGLTILDVRNHTEYAEEHIVGARHIALGYLPQHLDELPKDKPLITQCATGYRSQIAASLLRAYGFTNVLNLSEGIDAWAKVLPTERT